MPRRAAIAILASTIAAGPPPAGALDGSGRAALVLAAGQAAPAAAPTDLSPEERMRRRWPQPVRVGDLIGLPVLDHDDRTLGRVESVVRTPEGNVRLIVPYGGFLGWGRRPVAVPIEVVAIAGRQLAALDMTRAEFEAAPAWNATEGLALPAGEVIRVGLYRR